MATATDAELILKLYDLRREPVMRQARNWVVHEFNPKTLEDLLAVQRDFGSVHNQYWRQVISYWEMAAAFVLRGALDGELFFDSVGEIILIQAKFGSSTRSTRNGPAAASCPALPSWLSGFRRHGKGEMRFERITKGRSRTKAMYFWRIEERAFQIQ